MTLPSGCEGRRGCLLESDRLSFVYAGVLVQESVEQHLFQIEVTGNDRCSL